MKTKNIATFLLILVLFSGCKDLFQNLDEETPHLITAESLYKNLEGFEAGLNGLYALVREERSGLNDYLGAHWIVGTDNMVVNYGSSGTSSWSVAYDWGSSNNPVQPSHLRPFLWLYRVVNAANTIINRAENEDVNWSSGSGSNQMENKNRVVAEARAIRAWAYRHLSFGWGDVPLNLDESKGSTIKTDWVRTPVAQVRKQIISDLIFSEKYILVEPAMRGRLTKGAVQTLISEMYLTISKPDSALLWADKVINTPQYKLITKRYGVNANKPGVAFMDMFYEGNANRAEGNTEALWVWQYAFNVIGGGESNLFHVHNGRYFSIRINGVTPLQLTYERGGRGVARISLTKWAIDLYEKRDERGSDYAIRKFFTLKDAQANAPFAADLLPPGYKYGDTIKLDWSKDITRATANRPDWPYSRKAEPGANPADLASFVHYNDAIYMRLAATYLLKAEAQYLLGSPAAAAETINILRRRAKASEVSANQINIDFILNERSRELFLEEDRRWTLLRTNKWLERTKAHNFNGGQLVSARDVLFPIPQSIIDANLTTPMPQNPGY
ncbi:RagB/SusD family nutrient uptake outer membrane protein [Adhaeribacter aerolatus]|nr:RagB/SusD family nutrient uptake outer membrane protein [Adhaeribacter aerolatus]